MGIVISILFIIFVIIVLLPREQVHAYIDPGTGSFLTQVVGAIIISIIAFFRTSIINRIRNFLPHKKNPTTNHETPLKKS